MKNWEGGGAARAHNWIGLHPWSIYSLKTSQPSYRVSLYVCALYVHVLMDVFM